ncbi:MAG: VWA domain-containing protein [Planctomycetes bacterium]|nr:VWA domain-containing protein [Planctomycetota bacterium]
MVLKRVIGGSGGAGLVIVSSVVIVAGSAAGCSGGGGGSGGGSRLADGVYRGVIADEDGDPVEGARVSIDGIEAQAVTGSNGVFVITDPDLAAASIASHDGARVAGSSVDVEISVLAPGFEPRVASLTVAEGALANLDLVRLGLEPQVTIASPAPRQTFVLPSDCDGHVVTLEGLAALGSRDSFRLDVVLVADSSGSTGDPAFDVDGDGAVDTVLEAEVAALRCFAGGLDEATTRVVAVQFNDSASTVIEFTGDVEAVIGALDGDGPPGGGTNFEAALRAAEDLFEGLAAGEAAAESAEGPGDAAPAPSRSSTGGPARAGRAGPRRGLGHARGSASPVRAAGTSPSSSAPRATSGRRPSSAPSRAPARAGTTSRS